MESEKKVPLTRSGHSVRTQLTKNDFNVFSRMTSHENKYSGTAAAPSVENADKVVVNEVQADYFRKRNNYFCGDDVSEKSPFGGRRKTDIDELIEKSKLYSLQQSLEKKSCARNKHLGSEVETKARTTESVPKSRGFHLKTVGISLKYTDRRTTESDRIKEIDLETPCKIVIAVMLFVYLVGRQMWPEKTFFNTAAEKLNSGALTSTNVAELAAASWPSTISNFLDSMKPKRNESLRECVELWHSRWSSWINSFNVLRGKSMPLSPIAVDEDVRSSWWFTSKK